MWGCSEAEFMVIFSCLWSSCAKMYRMEVGGKWRLGYFPELTLRWRAEPGDGGCPVPSVVEQRSFIEEWWD